MKPTYRQLEIIVQRLEDANNKLNEGYHKASNGGNIGVDANGWLEVIEAQDEIFHAISEVKDLGENENYKERKV